MTSAGEAVSEEPEEDFVDPAPPPIEQMAIVTVLEMEEESIHVYSVSREWYNKWRKYVGLPASSEHSNTRRNHQHNDTDAVDNNTSTKGAEEASSETKNTSKAPSVETGPAPSPGPITMDLCDDDGNIYADEKIWKCWVRWYGVAPSHELDRRNWASDDKDFEICVLSPYCGLIENPVKTFDVAEQCGYVEVQLRQIFRVPRHRGSRLWACEKTRHSRFQPLLFRQRGICSYEHVDPTKPYILALEVANLDGSWPTYVPGSPSGSFDAYGDLVEGGPGMRSSLWETGLAETLETVYAAISNELKETATGIVETAKCVTAIKEAELGSVKQALRAKIDRYEEGQTAAEATTRRLRDEAAALESEKKRFEEEKEAFQEERHLFAEELVRMHTVNVIQETRIKLNIGGHTFVTSTFTLTKDPNSMLAAMFSGRHALKQEEDGGYFLDRDGTHFRYVLNYLRDGSFRSGTLPSDRNFLSELLTEAEYFQISGLIALLSDLLKTKGGEDLSPEGSASGPGKEFHPADGSHARIGHAVIRRCFRKTSTPQKTHSVSNSQT